MMEEYTKPALLRLLADYGVDDFSELRAIDSSHGEDDLRWNYILDRRWVLRINSAPVMTEQRLAELAPLIERCRAFGVRAPRFLRGTDGRYLRRDGGRFVYLSEYLDEKTADELLAARPELRPALCDRRLELVARYAERYRGELLTETRSMYSLFDLSPYDAPTGIDEKQANADELAGALRALGETALAERLLAEHDRIRAALLPHWHALPQATFQGDESFGNLCVDDTGKITGVFDFNMSGTDVCANYLANLAFQGRFYYTDDAFESRDADRLCARVLRSFRDATALIARHYRFTPAEHAAYFLCARLVMLFGYVNMAAFYLYLEQERYRGECLRLLRLLLDAELE